MIIKNARDKLPPWMPKRCDNDLASIFKDGEPDERVVNKRMKSWDEFYDLIRVD
jgi:hypothetical protein